MLEQVWRTAAILVSLILGVWSFISPWLKGATIDGKAFTVTLDNASVCEEKNCYYPSVSQTPSIFFRVVIAFHVFLVLWSVVLYFASCLDGSPGGIVGILFCGFSALLFYLSTLAIALECSSLNNFLLSFKDDNVKTKHYEEGFYAAIVSTALIVILFVSEFVTICYLRQTQDKLKRLFTPLFRRILLLLDSSSPESRVLISHSGPRSAVFPSTEETPRHVRSTHQTFIVSVN